jgi:hypothetical protein
MTPALLPAAQAAPRAPIQDDPQLPDPVGPQSNAATTTPASTPVLRSIGETAAVFRRTPRTIHNWIVRGQLRVIRVGRSVFIAQEEINKVLGISPEEFDLKSPEI